ncbi:hypothetical protein ACJMK2_001729 [Sinanodonta woodiana]|uniref:C-type lectin domain-containing protein n=1 Tax=Sinanodonta woodiana TaxID=1069815 RepID=A0ABD3XT80_SINWO
MYTGRCGPFCYRFERRTCTSFTNARQVCASEGGDLLNVDACYFDFFQNIAEQGEGCDSDVWLGASSASPGVDYITVRGDSIPQDTILWDFREPNPNEGGGCVGMDGGDNHALEDARCRFNKQYFCQIFI